MMTFLKNLIAPALVALLVASAANGAVWQWSHTASTNGAADPSINFQEGMSPSAVNDSARALMARVADWRDDNSGLLATAGTATAYTVTTNQGFASTPADGQLLAVTMHATNGIAATLAADGGTARVIQSSAGVAVAAGSLISGSPYTLKYSTANSAWMLRNFYGSPFTVPLGALLPYTGDTAPNSNFILPGGQCINRTTYATYFALVGTRFGACDGVTTFAAPDMRGRAPVGLDNLAGTGSAGRLTTSSVGCGTLMETVGSFCINGSQSHTLTVVEIPAHTHTGTTGIDSRDHNHDYFGPPTSMNGQFTGPGGNGWGGPPVIATSSGIGVQAHTHDFTTNSGGGSGGAHAIVTPNIALSFILRVL